MIGLVAQLATLLVCGSAVFASGRFESRGRVRVAALALAVAVLLAGWLAPSAWTWALTGSWPAGPDAGAGFSVALAWLAATAIISVTDASFDAEPFSLQAPLALAPGLSMAALVGVAAVADGGTASPAVQAAACGSALWLTLVLSLREGRGVALRDAALLACVVGLFSTGVLVGEPAVAWAALVAELLVTELLLGSLTRLRRSFESSSEAFQNEVLAHQYDEIRAIYLDMRGWRHDYHNHLQVMKAHLAEGQLTELATYLDELECDLDHVDTFVRSGNLMVDAVLNSKLSLAERQGATVTCTALAPEKLSVDDVDLCVILGNLLDNALESCAQVGEGQRFIRVYLAVRASQLYVSIQNAAVEDPSFDARHYVTSKRGEHGFGMRRVAAVVDKYEGFLNLANEPGVFAAEVSLPL